MNISDLKDFLASFGLTPFYIDEFIKAKTLVERNGNYFLAITEFKEKQVSGDQLIFIQLSKLVPSTFLLSYIAKHADKVIVKDEQKALDITYGKNLPKSEIFSSKTFLNGKRYLLQHKDKVLGYGKLLGSVFQIEFNIGEYLRENKE